MMKLTLKLGTVEFTVDVPVTEIRPADVFAAANAVLPLADEHTRLTHPWQLTVRAALDEHQAPSMSVGDTFTLATVQGLPIGTWTAEPSGWSVKRPSLH